MNDVKLPYEDKIFQLYDEYFEAENDNEAKKIQEKISFLIREVCQEYIFDNEGNCLGLKDNQVLGKLDISPQVR